MLAQMGWTVAMFDTDKQGQRVAKIIKVKKDAKGKPIKDANGRNIVIWQKGPNGKDEVVWENSDVMHVYRESDAIYSDLGNLAHDIENEMKAVSADAQPIMTRYMHGVGDELHSLFEDNLSQSWDVSGSNPVKDWDQRVKLIALAREAARALAPADENFGVGKYVLLDGEGKYDPEVNRQYTISLTGKGRSLLSRKDDKKSAL